MKRTSHATPSIIGSGYGYMCLTTDFPIGHTSKPQLTVESIYQSSAVKPKILGHHHLISNEKFRLTCCLARQSIPACATHDCSLYEASPPAGMPEIDDDELEAELDALGDDLALDEDSSYLDQVGAPSAPTAVPGEDSAVTNKVSNAAWRRFASCATPSKSIICGHLKISTSSSVSEVDHCVRVYFVPCKVTCVLTKLLKT